jgi:MraZ protein
MRLSTPVFSRAPQIPSKTFTGKDFTQLYDCGKFILPVFVRESGKICFFVVENEHSAHKMIDLLGEYEIAVDAKGRIMLPVGFRKQLPEGQGERFVINRGFENCLVLYPLESWTRLSEKVAKLNDFHPKVREFKRVFRNGANFVDADNAGRILLPKLLQDFAGIKKDIIFSAQGDKVELWDKENYQQYMSGSAANFSDLASEVLGGNFINPFDA